MKDITSLHKREDVYNYLEKALQEQGFLVGFNNHSNSFIVEDGGGYQYSIPFERNAVFQFISDCQPAQAKIA